MQFKIRKSNFLRLVRKHKVYVYPFLLVIVLISLTAFRISGTSIGIYHSYLYGEGNRDSNLLYGTPQPIRSDEWLVATQLTIAQKSNDYKTINDNYSEPKDLGVITDVPNLDWSTVFEPQNVAFLVVPLEYAFAFKWWLMLVALAVSSYFFFLKITSNKVAVSILASMIITFSPFVFWWYQASTILTLAYGFLIALLAMSIIDQRTWMPPKIKFGTVTTNILKASVLSYLLISFVIILYPPFQIPVVLVTGAFIAGYLLNKRDKNWRAITSTFVGTILLTGALLAAFIATHSQVVHTVTNTAYPGKREVSPGGYDIKHLFSTYLQPQLQREGRGPNYIQNQSESANFIVLPLFIIVPSIILAGWLIIKKRRVDWILISLTLCTVLFFVHLFAPLPIIIIKPFLLHMVPHSRLLMGLGLVGVILTVYTAHLVSRETKNNRKQLVLAAIYSTTYLALVVVAGLLVANEYPNFVSSKKFILALALITTTGFFFLLIGRLRLGLGILALFSIGSVIFIHPLYVGLGPIYQSSVSNKIDSLSTPRDTWAVANDIYLENLPQMSDRTAITGVNPYPSTKFWGQYTKDEQIYNRYAHIFLTGEVKDALVLVQPDLFAVSSSCGNKIMHDIDYIVSSSSLESPCLMLVDTVKYPSRTIYFYGVTSVASPRP